MVPAAFASTRKTTMNNDTDSSKVEPDEQLLLLMYRSLTDNGKFMLLHSANIIFGNPDYRINDAINHV